LAEDQEFGNMIDPNLNVGHLVALHKQSMKEVYIKVIRKKFNIDTSQKLIDVDQIKAEIRLLQSVSHFNIIHLLDYFESANFMYMCYEQSKGCTLDELIKNNYFKGNETSMREFIFKIAIGLDYLHEHGIVLRNLSPRSLHLTTKGQGVPRIAKLNKAVILGPGEYTFGHHVEDEYQAPEVVQNKAYNHKADTWAFGVLLFQLVTKKLPFRESIKV
jgi:serine/threonine protein kinase